VFGDGYDLDFGLAQTRCIVPGANPEVGGF